MQDKNTIKGATAKTRDNENKLEVCKEHKLKITQNII